MSDKPAFTVRVEEGNSEDPLQKLINQNKTLKEQLPYLIENMNLVAKLKRAQFEAYVREGFTEEQVLFLCKGGV